MILFPKWFHQVTVHEEDRDIWATFLAKALATGEDSLFDLAFDHSKTIERKQSVTKARADFYFKEKKFEKAAVYYAHCGMSFEEATLKLLGTNASLAVSEKTPIENNDSQPNFNKFIWLSREVNLSPVRIYLLELLKLLPTTSKSQRTIVCTWLCEIYLHQITDDSLEAERERVVSSSQQLLFTEFSQFLRANR